jgi:diphthamide synthase (EF-2-diphthine--ammonia ligase)
MFCKGGKSFNVVSLLLHKLSNSCRQIEIVLLGEITATNQTERMEEHCNAKQ